MPPPYVKKEGQVIHYYYSKLVIAPSSGMAGNFGFIIDRYKALERGDIQMSDYDRELWLKETTPQSTCAYCGASGKLVADHIIPLAISGPDSVHNIVRACQDCNAGKSDRDLIEWWDSTHADRLGPASTSLPRLPAGIYLKFAYDWLKLHNRLELPAKDLGDLKPFQSGSGRDRTPSTASPPRRSRQIDKTSAETSSPDAAPPSTPRVSSGRASSGSLVESLLAHYLYKDQVQDAARQADVSSSGTKDELIERLLRAESFDGRSLLKYLDKDQLRVACEEAGLPAGGFLRSTLEERLSAAIVTQQRTLRP